MLSGGVQKQIENFHIKVQVGIDASKVHSTQYRGLASSKRKKYAIIDA